MLGIFTRLLEHASRLMHAIFRAHALAPTVILSPSARSSGTKTLDSMLLTTSTTSLSPEDPHTLCLVWTSQAPTEPGELAQCHNPNLNAPNPRIHKHYTHYTR